MASVVMTVSITVATDADPGAVEKVLEDELRSAVAEIADLRAGSGKLTVRLTDVTDAGQVWQCTLDVKDVEAQKLAGHEVRKRLLNRLRRERIALAVKEKVFLLPEKNAPQA
jgi:hypothetical protein